MFALMIDFASMLSAALLVGALFGAWLFLNPKGLNGSAYVTVQQQAIRTMNKVMPALGAATLLLTITAAVLARDDRMRLWLLVGAALCFATIGLITRFLNQPINAIVMTWGDPLPANWMVLRDTWWRWHSIRLIAGLVGLSLLIVAMLKRGWSG
ncbi:MAG: hypothetical protein C5B58_03815 [Acidobacteria bacterium]|nr:MAG: hypothetical protein C5B58_03815 [Acidobacteriota bacterium]